MYIYIYICPGSPVDQTSRMVFRVIHGFRIPYYQGAKSGLWTSWVCILSLRNISTYLHIYIYYINIPTYDIWSSYITTSTQAHAHTSRLLQGVHVVGEDHGAAAEGHHGGQGLSFGQRHLGTQRRLDLPKVSFVWRGFFFWWNWDLKWNEWDLRFLGEKIYFL